MQEHTHTHTLALQTRVSSRGQCQGPPRSFLVLTENPGEAKVAEFDDLLFGDEDVFGFDVPMDALKDRREVDSLKTEQMLTDPNPVQTVKPGSKPRQTVPPGPQAAPGKLWPRSICCV